MNTDVKKEESEVTTSTLPNKTINNLDWYDASVLGLTDFQKWKLIISSKRIEMLPDYTPIEWRIIKLERFLFALKLSENDFTVDGVLKSK